MNPCWLVDDYHYQNIHPVTFTLSGDGVCDWLRFGLTLKPLKLGSVILFLSVGIVDEAGITVAVLLIRSSGTYFQQIVPQIDAHGCKTSRRNKTKSKMYLKFARNYLPACSCMQEL